MTDRELLELAAKAAGIRPYRFGDAVYPRAHVWNPLEDDGDALRLAVKLNLWDAIRSAHHLLGEEPDMYAATRRAIVCAAAQLEREK